MLLAFSFGADAKNIQLTAPDTLPHLPMPVLILLKN